MTKERKDYPLKDYYRSIYEKYDLVNRVFTFGQDKNWRKKAVAACIENNPKRILDICTGTGDLILEIGRKVETETVLAGYDFSSEMLQKAVIKSENANIPVDFTEGNVAAMPYENNYFDVAGISFGIRNLVYRNSNAELHLSEIHRVLRSEGRFVILESSKPENRIWRFINGLYLQFILPYLGGLISGNIKAYRYLAQSSRNYYSPGEMGQILEKAGFRVLRSRSLFLGSVMLVVAEKQDKTNEKQPRIV